MFKIEKTRGKFYVVCVNRYNKLLWSTGGYTTKQGCIKTLITTLRLVSHVPARISGVNTIKVQDNTLKIPVVYQLSETGNMIKLDQKPFK